MTRCQRAIRQIELPDGTRRGMTPEERATGDVPQGRRDPYMTVFMTKPGPGSKFEVNTTAGTTIPGTAGGARRREGIQAVITADRVEAYREQHPLCHLFHGLPCRAIVQIYGVVWRRRESRLRRPDQREDCEALPSDDHRPGDLVFDPTCGSGTTAFVAEQWGRRWITCDTSRVALALARTRLMAAKYPYYLLADSPEGVKKEAELTGKVPPEHKTEDDIKKGFCLQARAARHAQSIANNPDVKKGMTRDRSRRPLPAMPTARSL